MGLMKAVKAVAMIGPGLKSWIFSDGKFNMQRAMVLIVGMVILSVMYHALGPEGVSFVMDMLDEFSDAVGYED